MKYKTPVPTGEYPVGTLTFTVDNNREEILVPGQKRRVACRVYYPADKEAVKELEKAEYMSRDMAKSIKSAFMIPINYDKITAAGENVSECYENAAHIPEMKFPLIIFNHGYTSYREGNSYMLLELASHGYVVISVAHSMEGTCTEFDDGSVIFFDRKITGKTYQPFLGGIMAALKLTKAKGSNEELAEMFDKFQFDYSKYLINRLPEWKEDVCEAVEYAKAHYSDFIDFDMGIGATGHSFGGDVAYALCTDEPVYVCGINIDGALFGDYRGKVLDKPFMQVSGEDNENVVTRVYIKHKKPVYKLLFKDMKHLGFSDMKYKVPFKSMVGKLDPDVLHDNLCKCHVDFFDAFLKKKGDFVPINNEYVSASTFEADL